VHCLEVFGVTEVASNRRVEKSTGCVNFHSRHCQGLHDFRLIGGLAGREVFNQLLPAFLIKCLRGWTDSPVSRLAFGFNVDCGQTKPPPIGVLFS
jgi:hypothetical protein